MAQYIPDNTTGYEADLDNLILAAKGRYPLSGFAVTAQGSPNMTVAVAAGTIQWDGFANVGAVASLAISASDPTNSRIDLVTVSSGGTVAVTAGTPSASPKPPALPSNTILLALISVAAAATNIQNSNISDRRIFMGATVPSGGVAPTNNPTNQGQLWRDTEVGAIKRWSGSAWETMSVEMPNLVLNSDFSRRTVFGLAMPEVFADTAGWTLAEGSSVGSVASNVLTAGNTGAWAIRNGLQWRDGRWSASLKLTTDGAEFMSVSKYASSTNFVEVRIAGGATDTLSLVKVIAGAPTTVASTAVAPILNRWYWLELEAQGTTYIAKIYDTGGTTPGVLKASSTLLATLTGTIADAGVAEGYAAVRSNFTTALQVGGIATGNGGVYVETWLPESFGTWTFGGTLGGQAIGFQEVADSGPIGKQWSLRMFWPNQARTISALQDGPDGGASPDAVYTGSWYLKRVGAYGSGTGTAVVLRTGTKNSAGTEQATSDKNATDTSSTSWTRLTGSIAADADARKVFTRIIGFTSGTWTNATFDLMCPQIEQGSTATSWRNAPADDAPIVWVVDSPPATDITTTSTSFVEPSANNLSGNFFIPWDAVLLAEADLTTLNSGANANQFQMLNDGTGGGSAETIVTSTTAVGVHPRRSFKVAAGKHRVSTTWKVAAGTGTLNTSLINQRLRVTATRGK
jgi:hypothetical protein